MIVIYDTGGTVGEYLARAHEIGVQILGYCASACTAYLGAPDVCVSPDATLIFHEARNHDGSRNLLGTLMLQAQYPRGVMAWVREHGGLTARLLMMTGREAIALGVRVCR